ncbi:unnamed protein product [Clonostachys rosea f. rosea IK726]|uniref:Uncharacterized protein n=1 Tax=Clonostachys rosea f. rosea IK726 TaxID=1349383 RepID=A0ACA9UGF7_BIOOC|nr:unnamed protein product [Clonostachys rosea f. rosea IK726]
MTSQYVRHGAENIVGQLLVGLLIVALVWRCSVFILQSIWRMKQSPAKYQQAGTQEHQLVAKEFDWATTEPKKLRPFKPIYHITMAIQNNSLSELIIMDKNYLCRINLRRQLMERHQRTVYGCLPTGREAVHELYAFLMGEHLPSHYPAMFRLTNSRKMLENRVTGRSFPVNPYEDGEECLRVLGQTVEEDMFLLHKTPEGHFTDAFVCCFPSGFNPSEKLGRLLKDVHGPVPSYEKIGASMERYFSKLEVGKSVKRNNWSIQTHPELFDCGGDTTIAKDEPGRGEAFRIEETYFRSELQALTRLPKTGSVLFSFKTYMYPISEIKEEGLGPELADAMEGLRKGNAPGMWRYKGAERWAEKLCSYLRSP